MRSEVCRWERCITILQDFSSCPWGSQKHLGATSQLDRSPAVRCFLYACYGNPVYNERRSPCGSTPLQGGLGLRRRASALARRGRSTVRSWCVIPEPQEVTGAMIEANFYALHGAPFAHTTHPAWLFASRGQQAALQALIVSLHARQSCVLLLGEAGVGKTCLLHAALAHRDLQHLKTVQVFHPRLAWYDLCQLLCPDVGLKEGTDDAPGMIQVLYR